MGRFLRHILLYCGCFLLLTGALVLGARWLMKRVPLQLPEQVTTMIMGDSQVECALNDSLLTHTANLSMAGDAFLYSHIKLRAFLKQNPQVDTVWLSYNFHVLEKWQDTLTRSERYAKYKIPYHFFVLEAQELPVFLPQYAFYNVLMRTPYIRRKFMKNAIPGKVSYTDLKLGEYNRLDREKLAEDVARRNKTRDDNAARAPQFGAAKDQVEYLLRTVALCEQAGVQLILVNTPTHAVIARDADTAAYYRFHREHMPEVPLWDHSAWILPDSCFSDATHLNYKGATAYSNRLEQLRSLGWPATDRRGNISPNGAEQAAVDSVP